MKDLYEKTKTEVLQATARNDKKQEPNIMVSPSLDYDWESLKLKNSSPGRKERADA
jgi:hypothetical protein